MSTTGIVDVPEGRMVGFVEAITLFFQNYVNFQGRSSRGAYWFWVLASIGISFVTGFIDGLIFGAAGPVNGLFILATLIPSISLGVRRLHDIGRSGWWLLISLTIIGIILLIVWACFPGERKENDYGPDVEAGK